MNECYLISLFPPYYPIYTSSSLLYLSFYIHLESTQKQESSNNAKVDQTKYKEISDQLSLVSQMYEGEKVQRKEMEVKLTEMEKELEGLRMQLMSGGNGSKSNRNSVVPGTKIDNNNHVEEDDEAFLEDGKHIYISYISVHPMLLYYILTSLK